MGKKYSTPGVYVIEKDISEYTAPAGTSTGAIILAAKNGPVNRWVTVTDDKSFIDTFGEPIYTSGTASDRKIPEYGYGSYAALEFLKYSNRLNVMRIADSTDRYANAILDTSATASNASTISANTTPTSLDKATQITALDNYSFAASDVMLVGALGPGTLAHNVAVGVEFFSSACDWRYNYDDYNTSAVTAANYPNASKVFKVSVYTKTDKEVWTTNSLVAYSAYNPVETFYGTVRQTTDQDGNTLQIEELVNGVSQYIYVKLPTALNEFILANTPVINVDGVFHNYVFRDLKGGVNAGENTLLTSTAGYDLMKSVEDVDVNIIICPTNSMAVKKKAAEVAAYRKKCIAVGQTGARTDTTVAQILAAETYGYTNPSYMSLYACYDLVYDQYNDRKVYLPKAIYGAAAMARTDNEANVWDAPAGYSRGIIGPSLDQNVVLNEAQIGQLYDLNINTSKYIRGVGNVLWGQKTAQLKKSALDRINVRRLLNFIEESCETALKPYVLDITNTEKNRLRVWANLDGFLATVKADGGVTAYQVVCDATNNTAQVIDNNELRVDIFITPVKVVEFIQLQAIVTRTGVSFTAI